MTVDGPEIVTEGSGWHEQTGDRAELDVTFSATARSRADAVRDLGRRMALARPTLDRPGLVVRRRRLWVRSEWSGNRVIGCRAGEDVAVVLTDVTALEEVVAGLVAAEPTDFHGPRWVLTDPAAAQREAQRHAVRDARVRAEGYAAALNGKLGPLRSLSEAPGHDAPVAYAMAAMERGGPAPDIRDLDLEPEAVRVTARCTTSWTLLME